VLFPPSPLEESRGSRPTLCTVMSHFHFVTDWTFVAPIDPVWKIITDVGRLPEWWPMFKQAALRGEDRTLRVGQTVDCVVRAALPYSLRFSLEITDLVPPTKMRLQSRGDLSGWGQWDLRAEGDKTAVIYTWDVSLTRPVLAVLSGLPFARATLQRNHDVVMSQGFENLQQLLRTEAR
jgi:uncharacterized protein YndB with AHSA1/START domain